jgi:hypothetical protein
MNHYVLVSVSIMSMACFEFLLGHRTLGSLFALNGVCRNGLENNKTRAL